jgi:hypothetical protein
MSFSVKYTSDTDNYIAFILENNPTYEDIVDWVARNRSYKQNETFINKVVTKWKNHYE